MSKDPVQCNSELRYWCKSGVSLTDLALPFPFDSTYALLHILFYGIYRIGLLSLALPGQRPLLDSLPLHCIGDLPVSIGAS